MTEELEAWTSLFPLDSWETLQDDECGFNSLTTGWDRGIENHTFAEDDLHDNFALGHVFSCDFDVSNTINTGQSLHSNTKDDGQNSSASDLLIFTPKSSPTSENLSDKDFNLERTTTCSEQKKASKRAGTLGAEKRKWEESVVVFSSNPNNAVALKGRRSFNEPRRLQVALNRRLGACIQCKLRKEPCNSDIPCDSCFKRLGGIMLGQQLCTRQSLFTTRFNNIDLLGLSHLKVALLQETKQPIKGTSREMYLFWPSCCASSCGNSPIKFEVQDFHQDLTVCGDDEPTQWILSRGYTNCFRYEVEDKPWLIVPATMPSIDTLAQSCHDSDHSCNSGPFSGLHIAFGKFSGQYCEMNRNLPLQGLMSKILRMKRLFALFRRAGMVKDSPEADDSRYVSSWMKTQLKFAIGKGIVDLEADVLDELDRLLHGPDGIGRRNPLASWVCLWNLVLVYKEQMSFIYFHYLNDLNQLWLMHGLAKHICNALTAIYAALYRTSSPLTFDWRTEEVSEMLGRDSELIKLFCNIKTEMYWFHADKDQLLAGDELFKTLVVENECKLVEKNIKAAKKMGIL